jgi:DNA-binding transcriptional LysR family regulator
METEGADLLGAYRVFLEVADHGSMSRAAASLGLDVSIVSRKIATLEECFNHSFFERHSRGVRLTQAGLIAAASFRRILADEFRLRTDLAQLKRLELGVLRIACTGSAIAGPLSEVLVRFSAKYPAVQVEIHRQRSRAVVSSVEDGSADIGVGFNLERSNSTVTTVIFEDVLAAVVPAGHPLARVPEASCDDLRRYPIASFEFSSHIGGLTNQYLSRYPEPPIPHFLTNSLEVLKRFSEGGSGISIMCRSAVWHELNAGTMAAVSLKGAPAIRQESSVRRGAEQNLTCQAFLQEFRRLLTGEQASPSPDAYSLASRGARTS